MSVTTKAIVLVLLLLMAACSTLSQPEQQLDIPTQTVNAATPPDPETEYEKAKQECADKGGKWVWYSHGRDFTHYTYSMRCWSHDDPPRRPANGRWEDPGLLPYDVYVRFSQGTHTVIGFSRIEPDSKEKLNNGDQNTTDQPE